ncbi:ABC-2 transporter permease [Paenibacillus sp. FSL H8-0034]|uniref:ABC-2 transporter permease n=1 Tax=Paenibacillus sp. FSL H8-0034 TaxID=2954671 RepID=UPI0030F837A2
MHAFRRLFLTDLRNRRNTLLATLATTVLLNAAVSILIFYLHLPQEGLGLITMLDVIIFAGLLLMTFLHCFSTWQEEWKQQAITHLLSLPVPRTYMLMSKYIVILLEALLITVVMIVGMWVQLGMSNGQLFRVEPLLLFDWSKVLLIVKWIFSATGLIFLCFTSIFLGKCSRSHSILITFSSFTAGLLVWIVAFANFPSFLTLLIFCLAYFSASCYLLDKKVGIE